MKKTVFFILLLCMSPFVLAGDWNFIKDVTVSVPHHLSVDVNTQKCTIAAGGDNLELSTTQPGDIYFNLEASHQIDQSFCPTLASVAGPLGDCQAKYIALANSLNYDRLEYQADFNKLLDTIDVNNMITAMNDVFGQTAHNLDNSFQSNLNDQKAWMENTLLPSADDLTELGNKLQSANIDYTTCQADLNTMAAERNAAKTETRFYSDTYVPTLTIIILLLVVAMLGYAVKEGNLFARIQGKDGMD